VIWLVVDEMIAGRAVPAGFDRGAARGVPGRLRRVGVSGSPVGQQPERPGQFPALGRQLVGGAGRPLGVRPGHEQAFAFERAVVRLPEVVHTHHVTGNYDYLLQVEVADLAAYEDFHANRLASLPGVAMVNSYVTMKTLSPGAIG
jgi:DNA-binding Lrp family transcriptional regulator